MFKPDPSQNKPKVIVLRNNMFVVYGMLSQGCVYIVFNSVFDYNCC